MADPRGRRSVNARLQNLGIRHAVYWQRLRAGQVREVSDFLRANVLPRARVALERGLERVESTGLGRLTTERLRTVDEELRAIVDEGLDAAHGLLAGNLERLATYEAAWQAKTIRDVVPIAFDFDTPSPTLIRAAVEARPFEGAVLRDWFEGVADDTKRRVEESIRSGIIEGRTTRELVARIVGDDESRGELGMTAHHVETIVRTSATHVAAEARDLTYRENDDIVKGWVFTATLDARTSLTCAAEDGKEYRLGEGKLPPLHPGCRSTSVPILKSFEELGLPAVNFPEGARASMDGAVPDRTTYGEWIERQSAAVQDEALGPARAAELRAGRPIEAFVRRDGSPLTLAELGILDAAP